MKRMLLAIALVASLVMVSGCSRYREETNSVTIAVAPFESVGLVYVAQDQNLFAKRGLQVTYRSYDTGAAALDGVIAGEADLAVGTTEYPLVRKAFQGVPVSAIACIDRPDFTYLIGRKDRGIVKPSDLAGKRIGTVAASIAQFYLGRFLELNKVDVGGITFVDLRTPEEWRRAIANGDVDAVVLAQPEANFVKNGLGSNAAFFSVQTGQPSYTLAVSSNDWIAQNPKAVKQFLAALADAQKSAEKDPAGLREVIQERLKLDSDYMDTVETQNTFALSLDQSLITAMEDEARWMIRSRVTTETQVPDFSDYVHTDGLMQLKPEAVNIIR